MSTSFHRIWNICDKSFDVDQSSNYELSILLSRDGVSFSVTDHQKGRLLALETATFFNSEGSGPPSWHQVIDLLNSQKDQIRWFHDRFARCRLFVETRKTTLIPASLSRDETNRTVLGFNHPLADDEVVLSDSIAAGEMVQLFCVPKITLDALQHITGAQRVHCASSVLIELLIGQFKNLKLDDKLFVHVRPRWFELVYLQNKKLRFYNSFEYTTREDFAYYLLFVMEQLSLNPETTETVLFGEIEKESDIYQFIYRYVRHVGFARRLTALDFPFVFDELPHHSYFTILNTSLCEL